MRLIVVSQKDIAGMNVYSDLAKNFGFEKAGEFEGEPVFRKGDVELAATEKEQVEAGHLDGRFDPDYYVFASRHSSKSGTRTLTVHAPGNLGSEARYGGRPGELAYANPDAMRVALFELEKARDSFRIDYQVSFEATHHGPSALKKPVAFVEVGSTKAEWEDRRAVRCVALAAYGAARCRESRKGYVGIGGSHYAPRHTDAVKRYGISIGHIIPGYAIEKMEEEVFLQAFEKSGTKDAFFDWKGTKGGQRERVKTLSERHGITISRGRDLGPKENI